MTGDRPLNPRPICRRFPRPGQTFTCAAGASTGPARASTRTPRGSVAAPFRTRSDWRCPPRIPGFPKAAVGLARRGPTRHTPSKRAPSRSTRASRRRLEGESLTGDSDPTLDGSPRRLRRVHARARLPARGVHGELPHAQLRARGGLPRVSGHPLRRNRRRGGRHQRGGGPRAFPEERQRGLRAEGQGAAQPEAPLLRGRRRGEGAAEDRGRTAESRAGGG